MAELDFLDWEQTGNNLIIKVLREDGVVIRFPVETDMINFLAANTPKIYFLYYTLGSKEQTAMVDLTDIHTVASQNTGLKLTIGKKKTVTLYKGVAPIGHYCFARSETYRKRYLTPIGWSHQKECFDIYNYDQIKNAEKYEAEISNNENKQSQTKTALSKTKEKPDINIKPEEIDFII